MAGTICIKIKRNCQGLYIKNIGYIQTIYSYKISTLLMHYNIGSITQTQDYLRILLSCISSVLDVQNKSSVDDVFLFRALSIQTEYYLHQYRREQSESNKHNVQRVLKWFREAAKKKTLFQGRLCHLQAFFSYLRNKENRAKLLLEDCMVASKVSDVIFDYEWALMSKRTWFHQQHMDLEQPFNNHIKYVLSKTSGHTDVH